MKDNSLSEPVIQVKDLYKIYRVGEERVLEFIAIAQEIQSALQN